MPGPQASFYQPQLFFNDTVQKTIEVKKEVQPDIKPELNTDNKPELNTVFDTVLFEKYRPKSFNDIKGQTEIINSITRHLNNLTHMILSGPPGCGKTTLVYVLAKELEADILELNGSDDRGIDTIRGKVLNFVRHANFKNRLKIVFFDEADSLTSEAQLCLRPIIEKYSRTVRFIFACNYVNKIIDPLKSRCKEYVFKALNQEEILPVLKDINDKEKLGLTEASISSICLESKGDLRKAINLLQGGF